MRNGSVYRAVRAATIADARRRGLACALCLSPLGRGPIDVDHMIRVRDGGTDDPANLRAVHATCNKRRESERDLPRSRLVARSSGA
jgi:5-methylcytosine-specific restriction endonuclease McrA